MLGQLDRLITVAGWPNVTIQVLPYTAGIPPVRAGSFSVLASRATGAPDIVYPENRTRIFFVDAAPEVDRYARDFELLTEIALPQDESTEFIHIIAEQLRKTPPAHSEKFDQSSQPSAQQREGRSVGPKLSVGHRFDFSSRLGISRTISTAAPGRIHPPGRARGDNDPSLDPWVISEARLGGNCPRYAASTEEVKAVPDSQFGPDREAFSLLHRWLTSVVGVSVFQSALEVFFSQLFR